MKKLIQGSNRIYCLTNIFACVLCTGYLCTGRCDVNNNIQHEKKDTIEVNAETEPLSKLSNENSVPVVVTTTAKENTASKTYVRANYDEVTGSAIVDYAKKYLGLRYVSAGNSLETGTDCSGFTKLIYQEFGITLSRTASAQASSGSYVSKGDLQKGDLIFYGYSNTGITHVAIYIGGGQIIHQSTPRYGVMISSMNIMTYKTARRVVTERSVKVDELLKENETENNKSNGDIDDTLLNNDKEDTNSNITNDISSENNSNTDYVYTSGEYGSNN